MSKSTAHQNDRGGRFPFQRVVAYFLRNVFQNFGVLPFFLFLSFLVFSLCSDKFLTFQNLVNVARQSIYLTLASIGQMMVLITGGFDLSVGTTAAVTSVVSSMTMVYVASVFPGSVFGVIFVGILATLLCGFVVGIINGTGVSYFGVSPFIMTMGMQSVILGVALFLTGGIPISGLIPQFSATFGFGQVWGIPIPVIITGVVFLFFWVLMSRTRMGTYIYAVGGNVKAAHLSGIPTKRVLMISYVLCSVLASMTGFLLTARVESGEANLGSSLALESIAACVVAGISLKGGVGKIQNVVLGAYFIIMIQNGMNILQIGSYIQMVLLGILLILAVIFDKYRFK